MRTGSIARLMRRAGAAPSALSRRRFLQASLGAGLALMLPQRSLTAAQAGTRPRVFVIGGGFAGLSCAYQLQRAGADVLVLEARNRFGGRVFTLANVVPGALVEAGAELIGGNHPTWMAYAKQFQLQMRDVSDEDDPASPLLIGGTTYRGKEALRLWEQIDQALARMTDDARPVDREQPWRTPDAERLDQLSFKEVAARWPVEANVRAAATALMANDNVFEPSEVSYLGILATIAGGGLEAFWSESEIYRCASGNQSLAERLAGAIGSERLRLRAPVESIELRGDGVRLNTASGQRLDGDAVVLTAPPSTWDRIAFDPPLPDGLRPHAGPAIKYLSVVDRPFWLEQGLGPDALSDTPVGETWEATDGQRRGPRDPACLTVFSGGAAARRCLEVPRRQRDGQMTAWLEALYPTYARHAGRRLFMAWPEERWTACGYTSPRLGEVTRIYPRLEEGFGGRLFFAGEYASLLFTGFMEGGLHSGAQLAKRLAQRLNLL